MRIVHTSDWHIGKILNGYSLEQDQEYFINKFSEYLTDIAADILIIAGDIFDRSVPSSQAVSLFDKALRGIVLDRKIKTLIIAGNHDSPERLSFSNAFLEKTGLYIQGQPSKDIKKITLDDQYGKVNFYLLPYIQPAIVRQLFSDDKVKTYDQAVKRITQQMLKNLDKTQRNILVAHGFFSNLGLIDEDNLIFSESEISIGKSDIVDAKPFEDFDYVALGHLHAPQKAGAWHIRYSGSPIKYSISESTQKKSVTVIDLNQKGDTKILTHPTNLLRDLRVIEASFDEVISNQKSDDYIFFNITDDKYILDAMGRLRSIFPNILGLKYINMQIGADHISRASSIAAKPIIQLFEEFYNHATGEKMTKQETEYVKDIINKAKGDLDESD